MRQHIHGKCTAQARGCTEQQWSQYNVYFPLSSRSSLDCCVSSHAVYFCMHVSLPELRTSRLRLLVRTLYSCSRHLCSVSRLLKRLLKVSHAPFLCQWNGFSIAGISSFPPPFPTVPAIPFRKTGQTTRWQLAPMSKQTHSNDENNVGSRGAGNSDGAQTCCDQQPAGNIRRHGQSHSLARCQQVHCTVVANNGNQ